MVRNWEMRKELWFDDLNDSKRKENEQRLAEIAYELSGNFVKKVNC